MHSGGLPTEAASLLHGELMHVVVRYDDVVLLLLLLLLMTVKVFALLSLVMI